MINLSAANTELGHTAPSTASPLPGRSPIQVPDRPTARAALRSRVLDRALGDECEPHPQQVVGASGCSTKLS
jgi:hypothetical protein